MVIYLGEPKIRISYTTHFWKRWRERIGKYASSSEIREMIEDITEIGISTPIDDLHYRICYGGICIIFMRLSPLHSLAKTVYEREDELSAI